MQYLRTDEQLDVLVSIKELKRQLCRVEEDISAWKFAVISLMFATNGALACYLSGSMQTGALEKRTAKKTVTALQSDSTIPIPMPYLANPQELLERAQSSKRYDTRTEILQVTSQQQESFEMMIDMRNQFSHFSPLSWSIQICGLPERFRHVFEILQAIRSERWAFRHLDEVQLNDFDDQVFAVLEQLEILTERST